MFSMCFVLVGFPVLYSLCILYWLVFLFYIFYVFCIFPSWASPVWNQTCLALRALTGGKPAFATHCTVRTVFCSCMHVFCTLKSRKPASFTSLVSRSVPYLSGTLHLWGGIADTSDTRANQPPSTHLRRSPPMSQVISPPKSPDISPHCLHWSLSWHEWYWGQSTALHPPYPFPSTQLSTKAPPIYFPSPRN